MLLRSEADGDASCQRENQPRGEVVPLETVWRLSQAWYGDRMDPAFRGRSAADAIAIFKRVGLTSPFWTG